MYHLLSPSGENLLALIKRLASSPQLEDPKHEAKGNMVFYDIIGKFLIIYPDRIGRVINYVIAIIIFFGVAKKAAGFRASGKYFMVIDLYSFFIRDKGLENEILTHYGHTILSIGFTGFLSFSTLFFHPVFRPNYGLYIISNMHTI
jgi:hypothetical protein